MRILGDEDAADAVAILLKKDRAIKDIGVSSISQKGRHNLSLFKTQKDAETLENLLNTRYKEQLEIKQPLPTLPMLKVTNIQTDITDKAEFANAIKEQNSWAAKLKFEVTDTYTVETPRGTYTSIVITTDLASQKAFLQKAKVLIGLNSSRVHEYVNIIQCKICCKFGHFHYNCLNPPRCRKCGELHLFDDCDGMGKGTTSGTVQPTINVRQE